MSAIQLLDAERGFVAGWTGTGLQLAATVDGGKTFTRVTVPAAHLSSLRFIDGMTGWVGGFSLPDAPQTGCNVTPPNGRPGCRGVVLRTADGGRTWQDVLDIPAGASGGEPVIALQAVDSLDAWILAGDHSCSPSCPTDVRRTTDGGQSWATVLHGSVEAIRFASASRGWAALHDASGATSVLYTNDGGLTWRLGMHAPKAWPLGLDAASTSRVWLLTRDNETCTSSNCVRFDLYRSDDGGVTWSSLGNPKASAPQCGFGHLSGPLFASANRGWIADNTGAGGAAGATGLLTSEDGGRTWSCQPQPSQTQLLSAADPAHVWVTARDSSGGQTVLYASDDGGGSWRTVALP